MAEGWKAPAWDEWPCSLVLTEEDWSTDDGEYTLRVRRTAIPLPNMREADRYATRELGMLRQPMEEFNGVPTCWVLHGRHANLRFEPPEWIEAETERLAEWLREREADADEVRREVFGG